MGVQNCVYANSVMTPSSKKMSSRSSVSFTSAKDSCALDSIMSARLQCMQALQSAKQHERACIVDLKSNRIISTSDGTLGGVNIQIPFSFFSKNKYSIVHGHPTMRDGYGRFYSLPISFSDFEVLNEHSSVRDMRTVNSIGLETAIEKTDKFKQLTKPQVDDLRKSYFKALYDNLCSPSEKQHIDKLHDYVKSEPNSRSIKQNIVDKLLKKQYSADAVAVISNFWKEHCPKLNLNYVD